MEKKKKILFYLISGSLFLLGVSAFASLGEEIQSVEKDRQRLGAEVRTSMIQTKYLVQEITKPGLTLREYLSPQGKIFAISWIGIRHPDLKDLLGNYAGEFAETSRNAKLPGVRMSQVSLQSKNLLIEKYGHMRAAQGRVILPAMLPNGVDKDEIQ